MRRPCGRRVARSRKSDVPNRGSGTLAASALARHCEATRVSHDALGRPVATADSESAARTWTYNERSEMTGCTSNDGSYSYFYDSIGNRTSSSSTSSNLVSVTHSYTANGLNQYDYVDSTALSYDADGNLTGDGRYSYAYDCENRLVSVTPVSPSAGDLAIVNEYDHTNRRVRKTVRRHDGMGWSDQERHSFVWDGWNIVLERIDVGGSTAHVIEYYWGEDFSGTEQGAGNAPVAKRSGRLSEANPKGRKGPRVGGLLAVSYDGEFYVPIYGGNGSIMGYVDESGTLVAKFVYDPYGNVVSISDDIGNSPYTGLRGEGFSFGFSTKYHDREVGLIAYQMRSYSPRLGRWLNRDPIEEEGGLNLYSYCDNTSVNRLDILGMARFLTGELLAEVENKILDRQISIEAEKFPLFHLKFPGNEYALKIIATVQKLNERPNIDAQIVDFATTPLEDIKREVEHNAEHTYFVAHGGLLVNGSSWDRQNYLWNEKDRVVEMIYPYGGNRDGIPLSALGPKLRIENVYGCYLSAHVRKMSIISGGGDK